MFTKILFLLIRKGTYHGPIIWELFTIIIVVVGKHSWWISTTRQQIFIQVANMTCFYFFRTFPWTSRNTHPYLYLLFHKQHQLTFKICDFSVSKSAYTEARSSLFSVNAFFKISRLWIFSVERNSVSRTMLNRLWMRASCYNIMHRNPCLWCSPFKGCHYHTR